MTIFYLLKSKNVFLQSEYIYKPKPQNYYEPKITLFLLFAVPLFCMAQTPLARQYTYDASGNRTVCAVINMSPSQAPPVPPDSTGTETEPQAANPVPQPTEYFVEKIAQTEIKIYPNPTTEKITLEFSGDVRVENFRPLQIYSLSGQLLQEYPVHSTTTTISLAGMPNGVYILKVQINDRKEEWKIIKN